MMMMIMGQRMTLLGCFEGLLSLPREGADLTRGGWKLDEDAVVSFVFVVGVVVVVVVSLGMLWTMLMTVTACYELCGYGGG